MRTLKSSWLSTEICKLLQAEGHKAMLVGGCVRDAIMRQDPKDFDVATSAEPAEIESACRMFKLDMVGRSFGVVIASFEGDRVEIATFRSDGEGRRPDVRFVSTVEEDANRRDFTINAIYYDPIADVVVDPTGGVDDIDAKILRTPGDPMDRMSEDVLRTLRAVRFATRFGFNIDSGLRTAIEKNSSLVGVIEGDVVGRIPQERVAEEFKKGITTAYTDAYLLELARTGLWSSMFPGAERVQDHIKNPRLFVHSMTRKLGGHRTQADFIKALGFGNDEIAVSDMVNYLEYVACDVSNFSAAKTVRAFEVLGEDLMCDVIVDTARALGSALVRFAEDGLRTNGSVVMADTGLKPGKELGAEIARRDRMKLSELLTGRR
jgi:tRNA nucleotidyltransferase/poly(A) polymerase